MKLGDKTKVFKFPVFGYSVKVVSSNDIPKALLKYKHTENVDFQAGTAALSIHIAGEALTYIFVPHKITLEQMVHESYHAIRKMLDEAGVRLDDNEVVAYHLGHLVQEISDWRWSWKRK